MQRYGAPAQAMRMMDKNDLFYSRLNLLIVMAKAFLKGYPLGAFRSQAIEENAQWLFYEALERSAQAVEPESTGSAAPAMQLFFQRAQLLAVMCKSTVEGNPLGEFRNQAMHDTIEQLCLSMVDTVSPADMRFLKVA